MRFSLVLLAVLIAACSGCTRQAWYEGLRMRQEMDCDRLQGHERDACRDRAGMSYDDYQRQVQDREKKE